MSSPTILNTIYSSSTYLQIFLSSLYPTTLVIYECISCFDFIHSLLTLLFPKHLLSSRNKSATHHEFFLVVHSVRQVKEQPRFQRSRPPAAQLVRVRHFFRDGCTQVGVAHARSCSAFAQERTSNLPCSVFSAPRG